MYGEQQQEPQQQQQQQPEYEYQEPSPAKTRTKRILGWAMLYPIPVAITGLVILALGSLLLTFLLPYVIVIAPVAIVTVVIYRAMKVPTNRARVAEVVSRGKARISDAIELRRNRRSE